MYLNVRLFYFMFVIAGCKNNDSEIKVFPNVSTTGSDTKSQNEFATIKKIPLPKGYKRVGVEENPFAEWLQNVSLKNDKTVYLFDGSQKTNQQAQFAVLNISVGNKNLQQCADAVMRLRAEYLFAYARFEEIHFIDNDVTAYNFTPPYTTAHFKKYLDVVFDMCGSASLAKQLKAVQTFSDIKAGDVIIRADFPGHAVIVMDVAVNTTGKKIFLLAQSYMPAQDIHVLVNPRNNDLSPWYLIDENLSISTPEYLFKKSELKAW